MEVKWNWLGCLFKGTKQESKLNTDLFVARRFIGFSVFEEKKKEMRNESKPTEEGEGLNTENINDENSNLMPKIFKRAE